MGTVAAGLRSLVTSLFSRRPVVSREETAAIFREKYNHFQSLLESNTELLKIFSEIEVMLGGREVTERSSHQDLAASPCSSCSWSSCTPAKTSSMRVAMSFMRCSAAAW